MFASLQDRPTADAGGRGGRLRFFGGLRARLFLLAVVSVAPAFGLILYTDRELRLNARAAAARETVHLARALSARQQEIVRQSRSYLAHLARRPEIGAFAEPRCSAFLAGELQTHPEYANLGVVDLRGSLVCSALPFDKPIDLSDRLYFQKSVATREFSVGEFQVGRATRRATINFGYPVLDSRGELAAVVFAALDLAWLNELLKDSELPAGSSLWVTDYKGTVLARHPEPERWVGRTLTDASLLAALSDRPGENVVEAAGVDGVRRLYGVAPLRAPGASETYVAVGLPSTVAYAAADRIVRRGLGLLALAAALVFALAWVGGELLVLRPVRALMAAVRRVGRGELEARTGLPYSTTEIGELARAFDEMAETNHRRYSQVRALREIDLAILSTLNLQSVLEILLEKIELLLAYAAASIRLVHPRSKKLLPVAARNIEEAAEAAAGVATSLPDLVFEYGAPLAIANVGKEARTGDREAIVRQGFVSYLGVPMRVKGEPIGVLSFYTREEHRFTVEEADFLTTLAGQAAIAIDNARLYEWTKEQAEELKRSNAVKDQFLAVMSHELRTPLTVVKGYATMMQDGLFGPLSAPLAAALGKVLQQTEDLLALIDTILDAARIEVGDVEVVTEEVAPAAVLDELKSLFGVPARQEVALAWEYPADLPRMKTDGTKLRHILRNLIHNALKFTERGAVGVAARYVAEADRIEFRVADTGIGVPEGEREAIFEKFKQVDSSDTRLYGGVGLGLYIVKRFVEMLDGEVRVESELGKGSVFTVSLPCQPAQAGPESCAVPSGDAAESGRSERQRLLGAHT